jgi:hypothetical protein
LSQEFDSIDIARYDKTMTALFNCITYNTGDERILNTWQRKKKGCKEGLFFGNLSQPFGNCLLNLGNGKLAGITPGPVLVLFKPKIISNHDIEDGRKGTTK